MKKLMLALLVLLSAFAIISCASKTEAKPAAAPAQSQAAKPAQAEITGPKLFMVGDSTVSPFNDPYFYPRYGYGTKMQDYLEGITVVNYALSGRSSKGFLIEMNYRKLTKEIGKGDFLIIGFGHNDEKNDGERYTNPKGAIDDPTSFKYHLYEKYIKVAQAAGATPILATPIVRRSPEGKYEGTIIHQTKDIDNYPGGDYAQVIRDLAKEKGVYCIDNTSLTKALHEKLGVEGTLKLHAWLKEKPASVDNTHLNTYGASMVAYLMAKDLKASNCPLGKFVKADIAEPVEALVLKQNPAFVIKTYKTPDFTKSHWKTSAPWVGTVFGDCGDAMVVKPETGMYAIDEIAGGVKMRSGVEGGKACGKIASASDGIAFYFQQIPANADFEISAKAKVNFILKNGQVAFGLMCRDDVIIDKYDNSICSNYVACGPVKIADTPICSAFERANNALKVTKASASNCPAPGDVINLKLSRKGNVYTAVYGNEAPVTFTPNLNEVDEEFNYVGLFTVRNVEIEFTDIKFTQK